MINYQFFPRSIGITPDIQGIINCFIASDKLICSPENNLNSNEVLKVLRDDLLKISMRVENGKSKGDKIPVPVLFGEKNRIDKYFDADAISKDGKIVLEVEAGRALDNNQFLKDIFQACMMYGVEYLVIAVRNDYRGNDDFRKVYTFLETLYISNRLHLPLKGILLIGY